MPKRVAFSFLILMISGLACFAAPQQTAQGQAQDVALKELHLYREYVIDIDGVRDGKARVYQSSQPPAILILSNQLTKAVILRPKTMLVQLLVLDDLSEAEHEGHGHSGVTVSREPTSIGRFSIGQTTVDFDFEGHQISLAQRVPLLRSQTASQILAYDDIYAPRVEAYSPDSEDVERLQSCPTDARVTVFFGSWCPHCQRTIPRLIKLQQALEESKVRIEYYGVPQRGLGDPITQQKEIKKLPTAIVTVAGKEVGRLIGDDWEKPEKKLVEILGVQSTDG